MKSIFRFIEIIVNQVLSLIGLHVTVKKTYAPDLSMYQEVERPRVPTYLNIGAGRFRHPFWHNLDTPNDYYADSQENNLHIHHDLTLRSPLPFSENTIKIAYVSHVIEHLNDSDVQYLFQEVYRCLRPGGYFRITCPDIDLEYSAYCNKDEKFWKWPNAYGLTNNSIEQMFLDHFATALTETHPDKSINRPSNTEIRKVFKRLPKEDALQYFINSLPVSIQEKYRGDHINWFNYSKIYNMLSASNFKNIYESRYGQSLCPLLRDINLFDSTCPELSVYVECRKN